MEKKKKNKKLRAGVTTRYAFAPHGGGMGVSCTLFWVLYGITPYKKIIAIMSEGYDKMAWTNKPPSLLPSSSLSAYSSTFLYIHPSASYAFLCIFILKYCLHAALSQEILTVEHLENISHTLTA